MLDVFQAAGAAKVDVWEPVEMSWEDFVARAQEPAPVKECGAYVLGRFKRTRRRQADLIDRCAVVLDVDADGESMFERVDELGAQAVVHTTYTSAPDNVRVRIVVPLSRQVSGEDYTAIATTLMHRLGGADKFDRKSLSPVQFMYWAATPLLEWFTCQVYDGPPLDADELLAEYAPFMDPLRPVSSRDRKRDPFTLAGVVGAFNRTYQDLDTLIEVFGLPYRRVADNRYTLAGSTHGGGMGELPDREGLWVSHHESDPAFGQAQTAWDLVRIHKFGELDAQVDPRTPPNRRPSHTSMSQLALKDAEVVRELTATEFAEIDATGSTVDTAPQEWITTLRRRPSDGSISDCVGNWDIICEHDPVMQSLQLNRLTSQVEFSGPVPWRDTTTSPAVTDADRSEVAFHVERNYHFRPSRLLVDSRIDATATRHGYHPIQDWLKELEWDGTPRLETCLPGVRPTPYTRMVARKVLVAAVARMMSPGMKWDHVLVLQGASGIGKTRWIEAMSRGHMCTLGPISSKDTLLMAHRSWVVLADEGVSLRKADAEALKEFLTRSSDVYRAPYARDTGAHPRAWSVWATVNDRTFLPRIQGHRRFLVVHCEQRPDERLMSPEYIDQVWAEAVHLYQSSEVRLWLDADESALAEAERDRYIEEDSLTGVLMEYLDTKVPDEWAEWSPARRDEWTWSKSQGLASPGTQWIDMVCTRQLWREALGNTTQPRPLDLRLLSEAMDAMPGWVLLPERHRVAGYGPQTVYSRDII